MHTPINILWLTRTLFYLLLFGLVVGCIQHQIGTWPGFFQSLLLQTLLSLTVGLGLLFFCFQQGRIIPAHWHPFVRQIILAGLFALVGILGTELQTYINHTFFLDQDYYLGLAADSYLTNGLIAASLGYIFLPWTLTKGGY